jgi:hypothetical protein
VIADIPFLGTRPSRDWPAEEAGMNFWAVCLIALSLLVWMSKTAIDHDLEAVFAVLVTVIVIGGGGLLIALIGLGFEKANIHGSLLQAEALREAAAAVDVRQSEDIYGKVVDFNIDLAGKKWLNQRWWGDPFVIDEWMDVQPIPVAKP